MNEVVRSKKDSVNLSNVVNRLRMGGFAFCSSSLCLWAQAPLGGFLTQLEGKRAK